MTEKPTDGAMKAGGEVIRKERHARDQGWAGIADLEAARIIDREAVAPAVRELLDVLDTLICSGGSPEERTDQPEFVKAEAVADRYRHLLEAE